MFLNSGRRGYAFPSVFLYSFCFNFALQGRRCARPAAAHFGSIRDYNMFGFIVFQQRRDRFEKGFSQPLFGWGSLQAQPVKYFSYRAVRKKIL